MSGTFQSGLLHFVPAIAVYRRISALRAVLPSFYPPK